MNIEQQTRRRHSPTHFNKRTADSDRDLSPKHAEILTQVSASIGAETSRRERGLLHDRVFRCDHTSKPVGLPDYNGSFDVKF
jgi:hypothetical protein